MEKTTGLRCASILLALVLCAGWVSPSPAGAQNHTSGSAPGWSCWNDGSPDPCRRTFNAVAVVPPAISGR